MEFIISSFLYLAFSPFSVRFRRFINVFVHDSSLFILIAVYHSIVCPQHNLFMHSTIMLHFKSKAISCRIPSCLGDVRLLFYTGLHLIGQGDTHIMEGNLLHSKSIDLNVSLSKNLKKHLEYCLTTNLGTVAQPR